VTDLGILRNAGGRTDSGPNGINHEGAVALVNVTSGDYRAFLHNGTLMNLGTLGGDESLAAGINSLQQVVGSSRNPSGLPRAFLWTPGGTDGVPENPQMEELGIAIGSESEAYDINEAGEITGYLLNSGQFRAFRLGNGSLTDIGALLTGLPNSFGYEINAAGHVAGTGYNANFRSSRAFFYNGSTAVDIGHLGGGNASALAINDDDHIVGYSEQSDKVDHAFHYHDGGMTDLGTLGGDYSYAIAINNHNVIVGGSFIDDNNDVYHAFVSNGGSMVDLNSLLDASGDGWTLIEARAINDAGQIAGIGRYNGADHSFLLNPLTTPPPAPMITSVSAEGGDVLISLTTVEGAGYTVEASGSLLPESWSDAITGIAGNGGIVTATDADGADQPRRFYRVRLSTP
jgi:probable HAF family extracellular repeat protein